MDYIVGCCTRPVPVQVQEQVQQFNFEDYEQFVNFLNDNPDFLSEYIADEISAITLEQWLVIKRGLDGTSPFSFYSSRRTSEVASPPAPASPPTFIILELCNQHHESQKISDSIELEEMVPSPCIVIEPNSIVKVESLNVYLLIKKGQTTKKQQQQPMESAQTQASVKPKLIQEIAIEIPDSPNSIDVKSVIMEYPSTSLEPPKFHLSKSMEFPVANDKQIIPQKARSANGGEKPKTLLSTQPSMKTAQTQAPVKPKLKKEKAMEIPDSPSSITSVEFHSSWIEPSKVHLSKSMEPPVTRDKQIIVPKARSANGSTNTNGLLPTQPSMKTAQTQARVKPKLKNEKAMEIPDSPSSIDEKSVIVEFPSSWVEPSKVHLSKSMEPPVTRDKQIIVPKARSANGSTKTNGLLPTQQPMKSAQTQVPVKPKLRKETAIEIPDSPSSIDVKSVMMEFPSNSLQPPKVHLSKSMETPVARDKPIMAPKARSANGSSKTKRLLPVLDEHKKNITAMVEDLVVKIFPDASIEMYLVDQQGVYRLLRDSLEFTSNPHERIIRQVIAEDRPWFLNRRNLLRLSSPPKHFLQYFNKKNDVALIPLKVNFENIVVQVWGAALNSQVMVLLQSLQQIVDITLPYHQQSQSLLQESKMSAFLLQVAQAVFEEMLSLDQLIKKILEVAQRLVSADRASLFLVDHRNLELVSTVFDLRYEANQDSEFCKKEIRIPINKGIAGHVAMSGDTLNIPDAYLDERFNKAVDEATGYHTVSILCMPIKVRGKVLAVVQMVNKRDKKVFGPDDESAFQVFSTFFGLALHHAKLYDKIKRKEQKYKVALEVLGYHNTCCEEDVAKILEERTKEGNINYNDFALNPFEVDEMEKCKSILNMFEDLFDITMFDLTVLTRFVLTVKKNYRKVPYHNFDHGWAVANSMYVMLKNDTENRFDFNDRLALFVACLCHDLDHRGYTNKFMSEIASPLAAIYTTSTLEHHHFNMTVTILQQEGHNIFYQMSGEEYKYILDSIRQCILATDLAAYFPNLKKINKLMNETPQFDWEDASYRALGMSFCMTSADLSASAKPFTVQLKTVAIIIEEFYQQGDLERQAGRSPVPMMDRRHQDQVPASQVGFLTQICVPCYRVLAELFPSTRPMLEMVTANLETWKARAEEVKRKGEENKQE